VDIVIERACVQSLFPLVPCVEILLHPPNSIMRITGLLRMRRSKTVLVVRR
jgi:hypothetical protein